MHVKAKSLVVDTVCSLYALGLIVLGLLVPISNALASKERHKWTETFQDVFYIVQLGISIAFYGFVYAYLVQGVSRYDAPPLEQDDDDEGKEYDTKESSMSLESMSTVTTLDVNNLEATTMDSQQNGVQFKQNGTGTTTRPRTCTLGGHSQLPAATNLKHGEASYPNFYVRVGAVLFGVGTLVADGIEVASFTETWVTCPGVPIDYVKIVKWTFQILFVCLQLCFIFKYSKISINRWKVLCRFGMMHLLATNINEWTHAVVTEIAEATEEEHHNALSSNHSRSATTTENDTADCTITTPTSSMFRTSRQYLFPMLIEFSLISAVCLYNIYENIGMHERIRQNKKGVRRHSELLTAHGPVPRKVSTCHKSFKGLFAGVITMAVTTISIIMYNVYKGNNGESLITDGIFGFSVLGMVIPSLIASVYALYQLQKMEILRSYKRGPDETLMMITAVGLYAHDVTTVVDMIFQVATLSVILLSCSCIISIVQITLQVILITDGLRRRTTTPHILRYKPGREAVVLLLFLNLALWAMNTFEIRPVQYQHWITSQSAWIIIRKVSTPLAIFYRFHSTTCLYEIWKVTYNWHTSKADD